MGTENEGSRIVVQTRVSFYAYLLIRPFATTVVSIDGDGHRLPWGEHAFNVSPGRHTVEVGYEGHVRSGGYRSVTVEVAEGATARVNYWTPIVPGSENARIRVVDG